MYLNRNSGNVLFLILLAVALFAALSYAVTQSSRSGGKDVSDEDARLAASQIIQYATLMEQTITRLRLSNGCRDTQISFANTLFEKNNGIYNNGPGHNANAPLDGSCDVFDFSGAGGGVSLKLLPQSADISDPPAGGNNIKPTHIAFIEHQIVGVGTTAQDLILLAPHIKPEVCNAINDLLGLPSADDVPIDGHGGSYSYGGFFTGAYIGDAVIGDTATEFAGKNSFCVRYSSGGRHHYYYHVLIPR